MKEQIIVTLTTWAPRMKNIPAVLDSIFAQTLPPDKVVLNLSEGEFVPEEIEAYIKSHNVEVHFVPDTKVYKKLIPTLLRYPDAWVFPIDDDWIYPSGMIEEFWAKHKEFPNNPISGNRIIFHGIHCHCGNASLTTRKFYGKYLDEIDENFMKACPSDDLVYSYFAHRNGYGYVSTDNLYFDNLQPYCPEAPYTQTRQAQYDVVYVTWDYLLSHFGTIFEKLHEKIHHLKHRS